MERYLIKLSINYDDELDFNFYEVWSENKVNKFKKLLDTHYEDEVEFDLGSNIVCNFTGEFILSNIEFIKIPEPSVKFVDKYITDTKISSIYDLFNECI